MKLCAIYSRYSSDLQKPTSTDDQIAICERAARDLGLPVYRVYSDEEKSGTFARDRPAFQELIADAYKKKFTCVIAEKLDRLSRDIEDSAHLFKVTKYHDIRIYSATNRQFVDELTLLFESFKNQRYSQDLADRVPPWFRIALRRACLDNAKQKCSTWSNIVIDCQRS
jgi:DNA invertase Pin-like site-specific DNA recombinase